MKKRIGYIALFLGSSSIYSADAAPVHQKSGQSVQQCLFCDQQFDSFEDARKHDTECTKADIPRLLRTCHFCRCEFSTSDAVHRHVKDCTAKTSSDKSSDASLVLRLRKNGQDRWDIISKDAGEETQDDIRKYQGQNSQSSDNSYYPKNRIDVAPLVMQLRPRNQRHLTKTYHANSSDEEPIDSDSE